jgi:hypothetical protein
MKMNVNEKNNLKIIKRNLPVRNFKYLKDKFLQTKVLKFILIISYWKKSAFLDYNMWYQDFIQILNYWTIFLSTYLWELSS